MLTDGSTKEKTDQKNCMPTNNCSAEYKKLSITVQVWDSYLWICYFCARTWCHSSTYLLDLAPERGRVELLDSLLSPDVVPVYCALSHLYISPKIGDNLIWTYVIWCFTSWQIKFILIKLSNISMDKNNCSNDSTQQYEVRL